MLEPRQRRLLLDALRPPEGYTLNRALGTTYSLDLLALLTAPLAFTLFDTASAEPAANGELAIEPMALLTALRRHAERITLFCQAGHIAVPARHQLLFSYLEPCVFAAAAPDPTRAFHPKVWLLRFVATPELPVLYRFLCLSRNLTFDRSWDTLLVMDGELRQRTNAVAVNRPLGDFVAALPRLAVSPLPDSVKTRLRQMEYEVRRVVFEPPEGLTLKGFWPLGFSGSTGWPFRGRIDRLLVLSPFVSGSMLRRLSGEGQGHVLVSRGETLAALPQDDLAGFDKVYALSALADPESTDPEGKPMPTEVLAGLHAKLYLADAGWNARLWTGSANATEAAFGGNIEFLVELEGKRSQFGIDVMLQSGRPGDAFLALLEPFQPGGQTTAADPEDHQLAEQAEGVRRILATAGFRAVLTPHPEPDSFRLAVKLPADRQFNLPAGCDIICWPIQLAESAARSMNPARSPVVEFERISSEAITAFFAFAVTVQGEKKKATVRFVLNLPLDGAPTDRRERILRSLLSDRAQVLRLLRLLLADSAADAAALLGALTVNADGAGSAGTASSESELPLLETLIRTLARQPRKLADIERLVTDLEQLPGGRELLPEGFHSIWEPIRDVYRSTKNERSSAE